MIAMLSFNRSRALRAWSLLVALTTGWLAAGTADVAAQAAYYPPPPAAEGPRYLNPIQLGELVAPIALYPDDLIGIVLPASTLPQQVVEAAAYLDQLRGNPGLPPNEAWDDSIVALLNYPDVVNMMSHDVAWTENLGAAVIYQQADVLAAVRDFRYRAWAAGNLRSDEHQVVERGADGVIIIRPANPQVIYVPYYEPAQVLYTQTYPVYQYYPRPCPVYYYRYDRGRPSGFANFWAVGTFFSIGWSTGQVHLRDYDYFDDPFYAQPSIGFYFRRSWDHRRHDDDRDWDHDHGRDGRHDGDREGRSRRDSGGEDWHPPARLGQAVAPGNAPPQRGPRGNRGDRPAGAAPGAGTVVTPAGTDTPATRPSGRARDEAGNRPGMTPGPRPDARQVDQGRDGAARPIFSAAPAPATSPGTGSPTLTPNPADRQREDAQRLAPATPVFGAPNSEPSRRQDGFRGRPSAGDNPAAAAGAALAPAMAPAPAIESPRAADAPQPAALPGGGDAARRMDLPRAMENPRRIEIPQPAETQPRPSPQQTFQAPPRMATPSPVEAPRAVEMPRAVPAQRTFETPRAAEQPRPIEMPRAAEQPRQIEMPRAPAPMPRMEAPRQVEMPRAAPAAPRMEQARPVEAPRPAPAPSAAPAAQGGQGDAGRHGDRRHRDND